MARINRRRSELITVMFVLSVCFACAHSDEINKMNADVEVWDLQLRGQTQGKLQMLLKRTEIDTGKFSIVGKISGAITDHKAGSGEASFTVKGKIVNDVLMLSLMGFSEMTQGSSNLNGSMKGVLSESEGSGSWRVMNALGTSAGEFSMKKRSFSQ